MARLGKYGSSMCHFTMPTGDVASDVVVAFVVHPRQNKSADQVVEVKWHTHTHTHTNGVVLLAHICVASLQTKQAAS